MNTARQLGRVVYSLISLRKMRSTREEEWGKNEFDYFNDKLLIWLSYYQILKLQMLLTYAVMTGQHFPAVSSSLMHDVYFLLNNHLLYDQPVKKKKRKENLKLISLN